MQKSKGRSPTEELVSIEVASRMLRVSHWTIHKWCRDGRMQPVYKEANGKKHFPIQEIAALAEVLHQKITLPEVAAIATRALATALANERRLDELFRVLGLRRKVLSTESSEVLALYARAQQCLENDQPTSYEELEDWATTLFAIDEAYLSLVQKETASDEPWHVFLTLANKLDVNKTFDLSQSAPEFRIAYQTLNGARMHIRQVAYMFCRHHHGSRVASKAFGTSKASDRLLDVMVSTGLSAPRS